MVGISMTEEHIIFDDDYYFSLVPPETIQETCMAINYLPDELLARIFGYLHPILDQLPLLSRVCRKWRNVLQSHSCLWRSLHVDPSRYHFWHYNLVASILRFYGDHIQKLTWQENSPVYESIFKLIARLRGIRCLRLPVLWTKPVVDNLSALSNLEEVQINGGFALSDIDLHRIASSFPKLRDITLNACWRITSIGVINFLQKLRNLRTIKLKINSGLPLHDPRSDESMTQGVEIAKCLSDSHFGKHVRVLCLHFIPVEVEEIWHIVKGLPNIRRLSISNCDQLQGVRLVSATLQKLSVFRLWNVLFISIDAPALRHVTIDQGMESLEHLEICSPNLRKASIDGSNVLRTIRIITKKLTFLELSNCEEIDMRTFRDVFMQNPTIACLRLGCISHDSLTLDEYLIPSLQEICLLGDFACETIHIRSPTLRLLHTEAENDIVTLNHIYITANHICKVALVGIPALKTIVIQCVSVDSIEMNLCSDDQLNLECCVIHAMNAIGFLRLFDCKVNLLSVTTQLARTVVLYRCQMSDYVLQMALTGCPNIDHLNLEKCHEISCVTIQAPPMKFLNMFGCASVHRLDFECPQMLAVNLGQCPNIKLFIRGRQQDLSAICDNLHIVQPTENIRWTHEFPPQVYYCS